jgi:penicillin-binding protein 1C
VAFARTAGAGAILLALGRLALGFVPLPDGLDDLARSQPHEELLDRRGIPIRTTAATNGFVTRPLAESDIPTTVVLTTLAAEDARFRLHPGVDPLATVRAASQWIRHRRVISGASTITQQLVKLGHPRPRTLRTKLIEATLALRLETLWDKDQILRAYLARIDYGNHCAGLPQAALHYFNKSPSELDLAEAAFLAGLPQAPSRLNPRLRPERAKARQEWILRRCRELGWIDAASFDTAIARRIALAPARTEFRAPHFVDFVHSSGAIPGAGGRHFTSLDLALQEHAEHVLRRHLASLQDRHAGQAALVVLENSTGGILAMVGSPDWSDPRHGQVNGTLAHRSPGSALKPFTYLLALTDGATAADVIPDIPTSFPTATGVFEPTNYDRHFRGPVSLREALANSLNIPAVRILHEYGGPDRLRRLLLSLDLETLDRPATHYGLGLTLGDAEVRLLDLANAYATLARLGVHRSVTPSLAPPPSATRVLPADECWLLADILSDPTARADSFGLLTPLRLPFRVAAKTGTSSAFRDNWAIGFTPEFTVAVWVGNFDGSPMTDVSGVSGAAPILHDVFTHLHQTAGTSWYQPPANMARIEVDPLTGRRPRPPIPGRPEIFLPNHLPADESTSDRSPSGQVILPGDYAAWFRSSDNRLRNRATLSTDPAPDRLRILQPQPETVFLLNADQPLDSQRLLLQANVPCTWSSPSLNLAPCPSGTEAILRPGRHLLHATSPDHSRSNSVWIEVRLL